MNLEVRKARRGEEFSICYLIAMSISRGDFLLPRKEKEIAGLIEQGKFFVAVEDNDVIGCANLEEYDGIAELRSLVVDYKWKGNEIGKRLIEQVSDLAKGSHEGIYAFADKSLVPYYQKQGFEDMGKFPDMERGEAGRAVLEKMKTYCINCERYHSNTCQEHLLYKLLL